MSGLYTDKSNEVLGYHMPKGVKGNNHNPKGRTVGTLSPQSKIGWVGVMDVRMIAREWTTDSIHTLASIMKDVSASPNARVAAANSLLDRGWGKPAQAIEATVHNKFDDRSDDELIRIIEGTIINDSADSGRVELEEEPEEMPE